MVWTWFRSTAAAVLLTAVLALPRPADATPRDLRPDLLAVSVASLDASVAWHRDALGFALVSRRDYPDHGMSIAFMSNGPLRLELIQLNDSKPRKPAEPTANPASLRGFVKFGLRTDDIARDAKALATLGVTVLMPPTDSPEMGLRSMMIADPDGNIWQLFQEIRR